jgi:hypothetical protein
MYSQLIAIFLTLMINYIGNKFGTYHWLKYRYYFKITKYKGL